MLSCMSYPCFILFMGSCLLLTLNVQDCRMKFLYLTKIGIGLGTWAPFQAWVAGRPKYWSQLGSEMHLPLGKLCRLKSSRGTYEVTVTRNAWNCGIFWMMEREPAWVSGAFPSGLALSQMCCVLWDRPQPLPGPWTGTVVLELFKILSAAKDLIEALWTPSPGRKIMCGCGSTNTKFLLLYDR